MWIFQVLVFPEVAGKHCFAVGKWIRFVIPTGFYTIPVLGFSKSSVTFSKRKALSLGAGWVPQLLLCVMVWTWFPLVSCCSHQVPVAAGSSPQEQAWSSVQMLVNFGRERKGWRVCGVLVGFRVLLLPPLFKWCCRFKCGSSPIALLSAVSVLCFGSGAPGSSLPGGGSELPVCTAWPADRMAVSGCPCQVKWVFCGLQWTLTDLECASGKEQIAHTPLRK